MIAPLGRRWFSVDSKSSEIKVEGEGRKEQVMIIERRRGRRSWIRFREGGVRFLLKGVESFRREEGKNSKGVEWWENGRRYSLDLKENGVGRFIQCSVANEDGKRHRLFFPEGDGLVNGWTLLGEALQDLGFKRSRGEKRKPATLNIHRYDDNIYEHSTSALISAFGRPLLPGDTSDLGGINGEEDLEPLRVVAADGKEWGVEFSGALIEEGEGLVAAGRRTNEVQNEASELWTYERWEKSCLAKFSDFLGFPTKGFEKEITKLLRNLVNAQKLGKGKECQTLSKSERELRKLKWTINYKGKETSREDERDRGQLILKLK